MQYQVLQEKYFFDQEGHFNYVKNSAKEISKQSNQENPYTEEYIQQPDSFISYYKNQVYSNRAYLRLNVSSIEVNELLIKLATLLNPSGLEEKVQVHIRIKYKSICCDSEKIIQLLGNKLNDLQQNSTNLPLILSLIETTLCYPLHVVTNRNYNKIVPAIGFILSTTQNGITIKPAYTVDRNILEVTILKDITELTEYKNQLIIDAHYGYSTTIKTESDSQLVYIIPVDLQAIRPRVIDEPPLSESLLETESSLVVEKSFLSKLQEKTKLNITIVQNTIHQIKQIHRGQFRKSGELFYTHPLMVATILLKMTNDPDTIIAALLHDTIEDTPLCLYQIAYQYGKEVAYIVDKVTNMDCIIPKKIKLTERENKQKISDYKDIRVIMVKLADRLHKVRTLAFHSLETQKHIAQETLDFYIPLGKKLKLDTVDQVVDELEMHCKAIINGPNIN